MNKKIILGVTGGIAAYKSAELVRRLREVGAQVRVVMTPAAQQFITPLTMQALSGQPVHTDIFDLAAEAAMGHIELARWADIVLIAPASADIIAKLAQGQANDLLTTICLATTAPLAIAPAMNVNMWEDPVTQNNIHQLMQRGIQIWGPAVGSQACGEMGLGRMEEPGTLLESLASLFKTGSLAGLRVLVTAGPTQEAIDPVRYISNHSSGKMGYAIAQACLEAGAKVLLISGPVAMKAPEGVVLESVASAQEMYDCVLSHVEHCDLVVGVAAVADYRCKEVAISKIAKNEEKMFLELIRNPDILAGVSALEKKPFIVGFAAETEQFLEKGKQKLQRKNIDMIAINQVGDKEGGFGADNNALTVLWVGGQVEFPMTSKSQLARQLVDLISKRFSEWKKSK